MKTSEVTIGRVYAVKVSDRIVPVRVDRSTHPRTDFYGNTGRDRWYGENLKTGREVGPFTAARLRFEIEQAECGHWVQLGRDMDVHRRTYHGGTR